MGHFCGALQHNSRIVALIADQQKAKEGGGTPEVSTIGKYMGLLELILWLGVVTAAVSIPNFEVFGS